MPGINGPTSVASVKNADDDLARLLAALRSDGLDKTTDIIITSDHGFSTISKESATSWAAGQNYSGVTAKLLPPGFVAIDLAHALGRRVSRAHGRTDGGFRQHPALIVPPLPRVAVAAM